jgi:hypothetical protein
MTSKPGHYLNSDSSAPLARVVSEFTKAILCVRCASLVCFVLLNLLRQLHSKIKKSSIIEYMLSFLFSSILVVLSNQSFNIFDPFK